MTRDILIGIDAGTSVIKAVAFSLAGEQIAVAARPNVYQTLGGSQVEQDMHRTWADCAATLRELTERVPDLARRVAALAVTAQGDGTWLLDADGEPVGGGLLWLDSRAANLASDYLKTDAYSEHYARTGSGLNACMASAQLAWMKRWQPERIARAATCFHCKDWLYFKLTGARVTCPAEGNFTFGNYRTREYEPSILEGMGIADCARLLPPMIDGVSEAGKLTASAAAETLLPQGLPVSLAYLDVVCTALGGGLCDPVAEVGVSVLGSTGMHMRYAPTPNDVRLNEDRSGYTMCLPVERACSSMQSNMAATLNIDWLMDMAREAAEMAGAKTTRAELLSGLDEKVLGAEPGQAVYHPYIFEAGERGPFLNPDARAQFSGLSTQTSFAGLARAVFEGLAFATRDCYLASGSIPREVRLGGGAARSKAMRAILAAALNANVRTLTREELGASGAGMMAAVNIGAYPNMNACADAWVNPFLDKVTVPDPQLSAYYAKLYPIYRTIRAAMSPAWGHLAAAQTGVCGVSKDVERRRPIISIMGDRFMLPSMFEKAIREKCGEAPEIRSYEMPWPDEPMEHGYAEPGMEGLKEYQGTADEVVAHMDGAEIAVTHLAPFSAGVIERLPELKLIAVSRGGPVNIDMAAARKRKIRVVNTPGRNASAVAEFTIGAILAETRLITRGHESLRRGEWRGDLYRADLTGEELSEMTVGVIGYGHVGTKVVRLLKAFGCRILVCDPYVQLSADDLRSGVVQVSLETILRESDVVTLHARVTDETRGFIGREQFEQMKPGAYFVNTARGPMVDYDALTEALKNRHLRGAALETFAVEPAPPDLELLQLDNVTLTPHIAGASVKTVKIAAAAAAEEVRRYLAGEGPLNPC